MRQINKFLGILLLGILMTISVWGSPVLNQQTTIIIGTTDSIRNLDPSDAYDYFSPNTLMQITHGLMEMPVDSTDAVKGPIVESFTVNSDASVYQFELKSGIKFSDGEAFDANAMKWLLDRSIALGGDPGFLLADVVDTIIADGQTLTINLISPDATFLQRLTFTVAWPVSPKSLPSDRIEGYPDSIPAGLGPYMITSWTWGVELILEANPNYFGKAPATDRIVIKFYLDSTSLLTALESGEIDVAHKQFSLDEIQAINANDNLTSFTKETAGIRYTILNVELHTDKAVRQAISASINRTVITNTVYANLNEPIYSMVPKIFSSSKDSFKDGSLAEVATLMEGAGYSTTNKYALDFWYSPTHYGSEEIFVAELIKSQLEATGFFDVTVKNAEWSTYLDQFGTMGFFLLGWWFDYPDASNYIDPFAGAGAYWLGTNYSSTAMDELLSTMFTNSDTAVRVVAQRDAQDLMAEDVMVVPLFSMQKQFAATQTYISGFSLEPSENVHYNSISSSKLVTIITSTSAETSNTLVDQDQTSEIKLPISKFLSTASILFIVTLVFRKSKIRYQI